MDFPIPPSFWWSTDTILTLTFNIPRFLFNPHITSSRIHMSVLQYFPLFQKLPSPFSPPALARFSITMSFSLLCKPPAQKCVEKHESAPEIYKASVRKLFGKISMRKTVKRALESQLLLLVLPRLPLGKKRLPVDNISINLPLLLFSISKERINTGPTFLSDTLVFGKKHFFAA